MATQSISRLILRRPAKSLSQLLTRSFTSSSSPATSRSASTLLNRSRPLISGVSTVIRSGLISSRDLSTDQADSVSSYDRNRNGSNSDLSSDDTRLLDGCDFEHWLVVMAPPEGYLSRDEIIDSYIKTLAQVVGSEEEARKKIYSVSHRCYFAFGALVSDDVANQIKELPRVLYVLPDSYLDAENKDYGGEPFIDGKAVPYDPKYHAEWIRNNEKRNGRNNRSQGPERRPREEDRGNYPQDMGYYGSAPPNNGMGGDAPPYMGWNYRGPPPPPNMGQNYQGPPNMYQNSQGSSQPPPNLGQNYQGPMPPNMNGGSSEESSSSSLHLTGTSGSLQFSLRVR